MAIKYVEKEVLELTNMFYKCIDGEHIFLSNGVCDPVDYEESFYGVKVLPRKKIELAYACGSKPQIIIINTETGNLEIHDQVPLINGVYQVESYLKSLGKNIKMKSKYSKRYKNSSKGTTLRIYDNGMILSETIEDFDHRELTVYCCNPNVQSDYSFVSIKVRGSLPHIPKTIYDYFKSLILKDKLCFSDIYSFADDCFDENKGFLTLGMGKYEISLDYYAMGVFGFDGYCYALSRDQIGIPSMFLKTMLTSMKNDNLIECLENEIFAFKAGLRKEY